MFRNIYSHKRILLTGDSGFKGSWMRFWLERLGATVCGFSLRPETEPNHFSLLGYTRAEDETLLDRAALQRVMNEFQPDIVFHLAAQAIVRTSYEQPLETLAANVMGTANVLDACRSESFRPQAVVVVTSDKCYENREQIWSYRETDPMGGFDPYSVSKGCAELVTASWRRSFLMNDSSALPPVYVATGRAGNVVGGGDWARDRLIPDLTRTAAMGQSVEIRNPAATRPWQHVLEAVSGYLALGQKLLEGTDAERRAYAEGWNFGPTDRAVPVRDVVEVMRREWPAVNPVLHPSPKNPHEAQSLALDSTKARARLGWRTVWDFETTIARTAAWYRAFYESGRILTGEDLERYVRDAEALKLDWTL